MKGDNGLLIKATNAKDQTKIAEEKEWINLAVTTLSVDGKEINAVNLKAEIERISGEKVEVKEKTLSTGENRNEINSYKIASLSMPIEVAEETKKENTIYIIEYKRSARRYSVDISNRTIEMLGVVDPEEPENPVVSGDPSEWEYTLNKDSDTVTLNKYLGITDTLVIPNYLDGHPVVAIEGTGFSGSIWGNEKSGEYKNEGYQKKFCQNTTSKIIISEGIETIGQFSFAYSVKLGDVEFPSSLTKIENYAFCYCGFSSCTLTLQKGVSYIGIGAFESCNFKDVYLPSGISYIGSHAFWYNGNSACVHCDYPSKPAEWDSQWTNYKVDWQRAGK